MWGNGVPRAYLDTLKNCNKFPFIVSFKSIPTYWRGFPLLLNDSSPFWITLQTHTHTQNNFDCCYLRDSFKICFPSVVFVIVHVCSSVVLSSTHVLQTWCKGYAFGNQNSWLPTCVAEFQPYELSFLCYIYHSWLLWQLQDLEIIYVSFVFNAAQHPLEIYVYKILWWGLLAIFQG